MQLHYRFEDIMIEVQSEGYFDEPKYHYERMDVDYDLDVDIEFEDFFEFIRPSNYSKMTDSEKSIVRKCYYQLWTDELINIEGLEEDEFFIDFMTEKYYEQAKKEAQE